MFISSDSKKAKSIFEHILDEIRPSKEEKAAVIAHMNEVTGRLRKKAPKEVEIIVAGSVARDTQLRGSSDLDVFLLFPLKMDEEKMEKRALEIGKSIVDKKRGESFIIKYAEHPYLRLLSKKEGIKTDIVPAFKITKATERATAVDRTQLHNEFVISKLSKRQRDEVRLLKFFLRQRGIYGAEAKTEGFSGYLCELMVYDCGSFMEVLNNFSDAKAPIALTPVDRSKALTKETEGELSKRFGSNFVVVDPVDENRNVAANVSPESLALLMIEARRFLKNVSLKAFYGKGYSDLFSSRKILEMAARMGADLYTIEFSVPDIAEDILWQQLRKLRVRIIDSIEKSQFSSLASFSGVSERSGFISLFTRKGEVRTKISEGPSVFMGSASEKFISAHNDSIFTSVKGDRLFAVDEAESITVLDLLKDILRSNRIEFPSHLNKKKAVIHKNSIPESCAKELNYEMRKRLVSRN
jgi:tRNA nucleotidyltransferase (CCA-adding enzyme)